MSTDKKMLKCIFEVIDQIDDVSKDELNNLRKHTKSILEQRRADRQRRHYKGDK